MALTTRLSTKGQIVLPRAVRQTHGWEPGTELTLEDSAGGVLIRAQKPSPAKSLDEVLAALPKYKGKRKSIREMEVAISKEVKARAARGRY